MEGVTSSNTPLPTIFAFDALDTSKSVLLPSALVRELGVSRLYFTLTPLHSLVASQRVYPYRCMW